MGVELNRLMAEAGLVDRSIEIVPICSRNFAEFVAYGLDLLGAAKALGADGRLALDRSQRVLDDLTVGSSARTYFGFAGSFLACGSVPASTTS
jgi:hypothetical protein